MNSTKKVRKNIDINSYIVLEVLTNLETLNLPEKLQNQINNIVNELNDTLFPCYKGYDVIGQEFECITEYKLFIPKSQREI